MSEIAAEVVIIGAGVNGAGLFRDLCEQGVDCLLVDRGDFGGGTSAAPSRLIHGGLKYLETGELRLVRQSTLERNLLLRNAPHLVHPLPTVLPIFSWTAGSGAALRTLFGSTTAPRSRGAVIVKAGLALYDLYGRRYATMPRHQIWSRAEARQRLPSLTPRIVAAGLYHDAFVTAPERLVWELVRDGLAANPDSTVLTYARIDGQVDGALRILDDAGRRVSASPRIVVNAAGPWIDAVNATLGAPSRLIGGTKGSHVVLDHPELAAELDGKMIYFEADDGRICLVYDYLGRVLVGSTDIPAEDPDDVRCTEEEVDYFLAALARLLPGISVTRAQIVHRYAGLRPLPRSDATAPGLISRDHSAPVQEPGPDRPFPILSLVGGKWTTFRGFAEEVADEVLSRLSRPRRISTEGLTIGGGHDFPADAAAWCARVAGKTGLAHERVAVLLARYGTTAEEIAEHEAEDPTCAALRSEPTMRLSEIDWMARRERVSRLSDIVLRRTTLAVTGRLGRADLDAIAAVAGQALGWDEARLLEERRAVEAELRDRYGMRLSTEQPREEADPDAS